MSQDQPVHPQLMDPADNPEALIASSIYWYPLIFPTRTEVLDHLMLCNGNGYEGRAPENVTAPWQRIIRETRLLFAPVLVEQAALW